MKRNFVTFFSPGTFLHEETTKPIKSWDVGKATEMARTITERYGATPFAFQFSTRGRNKNELDSRVMDRSGRYFLGGKVLTLEQIKARKDPEDKILISNMECNGWNRVVENCNSFKIVQPLGDDDTVLDFRPTSCQAGNDNGDNSDGLAACDYDVRIN
jgi:hypothetical protein